MHDEPQMPALVARRQVDTERFWRPRVGIEEFTELRWMTINTIPPHYPM